MNKKKGAVEQLDYLYKECVKTNQQIYLFIDEYDHFTNKILSEPACLEDYKSETHGTGYAQLLRYGGKQAGLHYQTLLRQLVSAPSRWTISPAVQYRHQLFALSGI